MRAVTQPPPPPGWYPDPSGAAGTRWWDGQGWTEHVQQAAPPPSSSLPPAGPPAGGPSLYEQPVLLVNQKTKLIELTNDPDPARAQRATQAMLRMQRIDMARIRHAADTTDA